jgi:hypothetical protein
MIGGFKKTLSACPLAAAEVGGVVLIIDAKNERVTGSYASYGVVPLLDLPLTSLPLHTYSCFLAGIQAP